MSEPDDLTPDDIPDHVPDNPPTGGDAPDETCRSRPGVARLDRVEVVELALSNRIDNHEARLQLLEHRAGDKAQVASSRGRRIEIALWLMAATMAGLLVTVFVVSL